MALAVVIAGERFGNRVQKRDISLLIGCDYRVADARERDPEPLFACTYFLRMPLAKVHLAQDVIGQKNETAQPPGWWSSKCRR